MNMDDENDKLKFATNSVPNKQFLKAVEAFFGLLEEITASLYHSRGAISWSAKILPGSNMVQAVAEKISDPNANPKDVLKTNRNGLKKLIHSRAKWPKDFSEKALEDAKILSELSDPKTLPISIVSKNEEQEISPQICINVEKLLEATFFEIGTIEGRLQVLAKKEQYYFSIKDEVTGRLVRCIFPKDMLEDAKDAFDRRVSVTGLIHYRRDEKISHIDVMELYRFPLDIELPDYSEICGILGDAG